MDPERDRRQDDPEYSPLRRSPVFSKMQETADHAGGMLLMLGCIILSIFLFHDLMANALWLWFLLTAGIIGIVFSLVHWVRRSAQQSIDEENQRVDQIKKEAEATRLRRLEEDRKKEYAAKKEEALKQERIRRQVEELLNQHGDEYQLEKNVFLTEISEETSMLTIWNIWRKHQLAEANPEADAFILKYKEAERMYGKLSTVDSLKEELKALLR
ncbi:MAG: hypothetical protein IKZ98_08395 [Clostridia bacterium]|nr:hypothetical protein [Clostridia bacterium]